MTSLTRGVARLVSRKTFVFRNFCVMIIVQAQATSSSTVLSDATVPTSSKSLTWINQKSAQANKAAGRQKSNDAELSESSDVLEALRLSSIDEWLPSLEPDITGPLADEGGEPKTDFGELIGDLFPEGGEKPEVEVSERYNEVRRRALFPVVKQFLHHFRPDTPFLYKEKDVVDATTTATAVVGVVPASKEDGSSNSGPATSIMRRTQRGATATSDVHAVDTVCKLPSNDPANLQSGLLTNFTCADNFHRYNYTEELDTEGIPYVLTKLLSQTRASCFDVLAALEYLITNLLRYQTEKLRKELHIDVQAVSRNSQRAFQDNTLLNEYNEVAGMELFYFYGSGMIQLLEEYLRLLLSTIMLQPHCFNAETRLQLCKLLTTDFAENVRNRWRKIEFTITWKNLYHLTDAFRLRTHVTEMLDVGIYNVVDLFHEIQLSVLRKILDDNSKRTALLNKPGQNTEAEKIGHDWTTVEKSGGFVDFLYLYRTKFDHWSIDKSLIRGIIRMFANEASNVESVVDLGAGGGKYSELLELGFPTVFAVDASPHAFETTKQRVHYADLSRRMVIKKEDATGNNSREQNGESEATSGTAGHQNSFSVVFEDGGVEEGEDANEGNREAHQEQGVITTTDTNTLSSAYRFDLAICIEVAEHIAKEHENTLIQNLNRVSNRFLVLSWSNDRENDYHVNPLPQDEVVAMMEARTEFRIDREKSEKLKKAASIAWIKDNVLVFEKVHGNG
ncbi:unnamed protein product, partial [Amoebophrya sp. A120]|eukprot:GSA120T00007612001.1